MKKPPYILLPLLLLAASCQDKQATSEIIINPKLHFNYIKMRPGMDTAIYRGLTEIGVSEVEAKRTAYSGSNLEFVEVADTFLFRTQMSSVSSYLKNDTLTIHFTSASPIVGSFSGSNAVVTIVNEMVSSKVRYYTDAITEEGSGRFSVNSVYNNLTISKGEFEKGDTIAGELFLRTDEIQQVKDNRKVFASGAFRTIIE